MLLVRDDTAIFQPVTVLEWPAARLIVTTGLAEGDAVIVDSAGLEPGQAVAPDQR